MAGNWFEQLCRQAGLAVHHAVEPLRGEKRKQTVRHDVEEREGKDGVVLRRTTIEEIEYRDRDA